MTNSTPTRPRSIQFNARITPAQLDRLEAIARERSFFGGPGLKKDEPNLSLAARWLWGEADPVMRENDVVLEWDRNA